MVQQSINPNHIALMEGFRKAIADHALNMPADEILAVASQFIGNLIAVQDCRKYDSASIMQIVMVNIEIGNAAAISGINVSSH